VVAACIPSEIAVIVPDSAMTDRGPLRTRLAGLPSAVEVHPTVGERPSSGSPLAYWALPSLRAAGFVICTPVTAPSRTLPERNASRTSELLAP
jgi:hypothetical protein